MQVALLVATVTAGVAAFLMGVLVHRLLLPSRYELVCTEWLSHFSVERYLPIQRLLSEEDFRWLSAQKGCTPRLVKRLKRQRAEAFIQYLNLLKADYGQLEAAVKVWMANSPVDRPDLAKALFRRRLLFTRHLLEARLRVLFFRFGLASTDSQALIGSLDDLRCYMRQLALASPRPAA